MPPEQQDNVWISREEYERLRSVAQPSNASTAPTVSVGTFVQGGISDEAITKTSHLQMIIGVLLGSGLLLALSTGLRPLAVVITIIFLAYAVVGFVQYTRRRPANDFTAGTPASTNLKRIAKILFIIAGVVMLLPVLFYGGMILLLIIFVSLGGGRGS